MLSFLFGSRGLRPDLPSPFGRKFLFCLSFIILATIYCQSGNPNFRLFETIDNLSDNVMFLGDFNSKLEAFSYAKKNSSGPVLKNIQNHPNLTYLNNDEHTHLDRAKNSTDILDMALFHQT